MKKKPILNAYETKLFNDWIEDGNAFKNDKGVWLEQTTQYSKKFTYDELQNFFKREYLAEGYNGGGRVKTKEYFQIYKLEDLRRKTELLITDVELNKFLDSWNLDYNTDYADWIEFNEYEDGVKITPVFSKNEYGGNVNNSFVESEINSVSTWENEEIATYLEVPVNEVAKHRDYYVEETQNAMLVNQVDGDYAGGGGVKLKNNNINWVKNVGEEGWSKDMAYKNAYENSGGYISTSGNWQIYRDGRFYYDKDMGGDNYKRDGDWIVRRNDEFYGEFDSLIEAKEFVENWVRINPKDYAGGGIIEVVGKGNKGSFRKREYEGMTEKEVADFWLERGYTLSKSRSESKLKPYTFYIQKYDDGGGVGEFPPKGELTNKDNFLLKYEKKGGEYEFFVYKPITKEVSGYNQIKHVCLNKDCPQKMNYEQFINYLYAELYLDDTQYAGGGEVTYMQYNGVEIIYEPHFKMSNLLGKYYVNDEMFTSLYDAIKYIDKTDKMPNEITGNDNIKYIKVKTHNNPNGEIVTNYEGYWNGHIIDGFWVGNINELNRYIEDRILSINQYNKLKHLPIKELPKYAGGGGVGEPYDSMTKYQIEKEYKKLNEKRRLLIDKYGDFESDEILENEKEIDKIITLLYGKNFSGNGQKFRYADGGLTRGEIEDKIAGLRLRIAKTKKQVSTFETTNRGKFNNLWEQKVVPLQKELTSLSELWRDAKYEDGGDVPHADKMFQLPLEMVIYVPSTQDVDKVISVDKMDKRVDEVKIYLANKFGGYTSADKLGGFVDSTGNLVNEDVVQVTSFSTKEAYAENKEELINQLAKWGEEWGQESIGFEFEGDLMYVPQKFKKGGEIENIKVGDEIYARWTDSSQWTLGTFKGETKNGFEVYDRTIERPEYIEYYPQISKLPHPYGNEKTFYSKNFKDRNYKNYHFIKEIQEGNYKQGGESKKIGFKGLANKVANRYEGKKVAPKFQSEYGKTYSKEEAQEVGNKVAGKVYREQQSNKLADGGQPVQYVPVQQIPQQNIQYLPVQQIPQQPVQYVPVQQMPQQSPQQSPQQPANSPFGNFDINSAINFVKENPQVLSMLKDGGKLKEYNHLKEYYEKYVNGGFVGGDIIKFKFDGKEFTRKVESVDDMGNALVNLMKTQKATINPADIFDIKKDFSEKDVIIKKIGLNENLAEYLVSVSPTFAVWFADAIVENEIEERQESKEVVLKAINEKSISKNTNYFNNNFGGAIREILDWLQHPSTPKQNLRDLSFNEALEKSRQWHQELTTSGGDLNFVEPEENTVLITYPPNEFGKTYYWVFIPKNYCDIESSRMGHCGRTGAGSLISLRSFFTNINNESVTDSHVTIAYNKDDGLFYQAKGKQNRKPVEKYFPYIFNLIKLMASGKLEEEYKLKIEDKLNDLRSQEKKAQAGLEKIAKYFESKEARTENAESLVEKANKLVSIREKLNEIAENIKMLDSESRFDFNGFGSEYQSSNDYGYEDFTTEQIKELYPLKPEIFKDFAGEYMLYQAGVVSEKPNTIFTLEKPAEYVSDLLRLNRDFSDDFVRQVLTGDTDDLFSGDYSYYYTNAGDYVDDLNKEDYDKVLNEIVEITQLDKEIVKKNGAKYYLDGDDEEFSADNFGDIKIAIANSLEGAERSSYENYYYNQIKDALQELGTVKELTDEGVILEIDLANLISIGEISSYMKDLDSDSLQDVFFEAESNSGIELPSLNIDERYSGSTDGWQEYFDINNYAEGGAVYPDLSMQKAQVVNDSIRIPEFELKQAKEVVVIEGVTNKKILNSDDAIEIFRNIWGKDTINAYEQCYVLYLNKGMKPIGYYHHSKGGIDGTVMDIQMISGMAIKSLAKGVMIAHNHPSGNTQPSDADKRITEQMKKALKLFNIELLDSIILTDKSDLSFADEGLL